MDFIPVGHLDGHSSLQVSRGHDTRLQRQRRIFTKFDGGGGGGGVGFFFDPEMELDVFKFHKNHY